MGERELGELVRLIDAIADLVAEVKTILAGQCAHEDAVEVTTMGSLDRRWHCRKCGKIISGAGWR